MSGNIEKLPKWAQSHIKVLEMRLREQRERKEELEALYRGEGETNVILVDHTNGDKPLPKNSTIRFKTGKQQDWENIDIRVDRRGMLEVRGMRGISVRPEAANMIRIKVERDW